jgi:hypothetical protein
MLKRMDFGATVRFGPHTFIICVAGHFDGFIPALMIGAGLPILMHEIPIVHGATPLRMGGGMPIFTG